MSRKGENIHKRKDGRWEARILLKQPYAKTSYHSVYGKSYREVKEKKEEFIKNRPQVKIMSERIITFKELLYSWLENRVLSQKESTKLKYINIIETHIIPELGNIKVRDIDDVIINRFLSKKKESGNLITSGSLSNSYVKSMAIIINSAISYAVEKEYRPPLKSKILKPSISKKEISVLTETEQQTLEEFLSFDQSLTSLGIVIALNTGLRIGEICALKWGDIDLNNRIIKVRNSIIRVPANENEPTRTKYIISSTKTETSTRDIPITTKLFPILVKSHLNNEFYVVSGSSSFVCPRTYEYRYHNILKQYEFPDTNFHTLRHTFATRCVEKNVDIKTLSEILGHSNVSITLNTYVHPSFDVKRIQMEKLCSFS